MYRVIGRCEGMREVGHNGGARVPFGSEGRIDGYQRRMFVLSRTSLLGAPECSSLLADKAKNHWGRIARKILQNS